MVFQSVIMALQNRNQSPSRSRETIYWENSGQFIKSIGNGKRCGLKIKTIQ